MASVPSAPAQRPSLGRARGTTTTRREPTTSRCSWEVRSYRPCRRWACPACRDFKAAELAEEVRLLLDRAHLDGHPVFWITVTPPARSMHLAPFNRSCSRWLEYLARSGLKWPKYVATLGINERTGRLHRHYVFIGGSFIAQPILSDVAVRAGLGPNVHIERVRASAQDRIRLSRYFASNAHRYALAHAHAGGRIAPVSRSR